MCEDKEGEEGEGEEEGGGDGGGEGEGEEEEGGRWEGVNRVRKLQDQYAEQTST